MKITVFGNTAIATGSQKLKGTDASGQALDENERWTDTWVKVPSGKCSVLRVISREKNRKQASSEVENSNIKKKERGTDMNRKIMVTLVAVCCLAVGITLVAQEGGDASSKVEQLEKEMHHAQRNSDASWYQQHLADGYVEGYSWGDWATKAEAIKDMQDKSIKFNKAELSDVKVATFGPNTAVAHYKFTYDGTLNGVHRARTVICSDTWISESGEWKIASNHCSQVEGK